jgi:hypothetical protein
MLGAQASQSSIPVGDDGYIKLEVGQVSYTRVLGASAFH